MRRSVLVLAAALLGGCGDRNLVVNVDVLSYLDASATRLAFGPVLPVPGGLTTGEVAIVQDAHINLIERPNDLAKTQSVSLTIEAEVADSTGAGSDTLRLYLSDSGTDPTTLPAVATLPIDLVNGRVDTVRVDVSGDSRVVSLFDGSSLRLTATNAVRGPASGAALNGRVQFTMMRATVVAGRKGL
jgi:hypothetical protein